MKGAEGNACPQGLLFSWTNGASDWRSMVILIKRSSIKIVTETSD